MKTIVFIVGTADGRAAPEAGRFLMSYNANGNNGNGYIGTTANKALALRFDDDAAAMDCWKWGSKTHPMRTDGKPNRPLTAFTIELVRVES